MTTNDSVDALILSQCDDQPQKVAMIVARVAELVSGIDPEVIGDRIALLTEAGKLSAFGDVTDWRHSEIALSPDH